ncbi:posphoenolpyruvate synthetase regulatory kinase/phosphorylase PpsR [Sulfurirhabdus autotrophica]|uniref:Putative phosphoenolpyruvate synthase regulatory protein n=1 Tax=Sulfurirhabdus autotrophica TaxID=1706046 RepID=A0A4V2W318_9PROT|nr:pyruvate, water dikinase regulatory protein [Sulfurirhabdus autotrophica]TCV90199.1 hypothetical protein EDC63_101166 [Sulfurirhabdus autotrophica]
MTIKRNVFYVSDRTGITAELLGRTLLSQFQGAAFNKTTLPFIDTVEKARTACIEINQAFSDQGVRPLVFSTLINPNTRNVITACNGLVLDLFEMFIRPLEKELGEESSHVLGLSHGISDHDAYNDRIDAINFTLNHDDGITTANFELADIILIGVSRSGKTPTCLYLAMQYGIRAANYPLTPDDFSDGHLPKLLQPFRKKLYGLSITPDRLHKIRSERKPDSQYASLDNCRAEIRKAESIFHSEAIPYLDTSTKSVEEISITILHAAHLHQAHPAS